MPIWGKFLDACLQKGLSINTAKTVLVPQDVADKAMGVLGLNVRRGAGLRNGCGVLVLVLQGEDGLSRARSVVSQFEGQGQGQGSSAELFVCNSGLEATALAALLLGGPRGLQSSVTLDNCTCCIIKPHAVKAKLTGAILDHILGQGYEVSAIATLYFDRTQVGSLSLSFFSPNLAPLALGCLAYS